MARHLTPRIIFSCALVLASTSALATNIGDPSVGQNAQPAPGYSTLTGYKDGSGNTKQDSATNPHPQTLYDANGDQLNFQTPTPIIFSSQYPFGSTPITGNSTGTTSSVVGTLAGVSGKTTYICGFTVDAIGGTATVGPIVVAGLIGSSGTFGLFSSATGARLPNPYNNGPCLKASAVNTPITITTTADGTASSVYVNSWGYQI